MTTRIFSLTLLLCVLTFVVSDVSAQNKRLGTAGASELLIPVGGRDLAMGGAGIASSRGVEALYWNPAGVARTTGAAEGMFSYMSYIADIKMSYAAVTANFGGIGSLGFSLKTLSFGDIPLTTEDDPENRTGRTYSPNYTTLSLGYGRALTDAISFGGVVKLISERIDLVSASGVAFDVGVQYSQLAGFRGLTLGVAVKNIGPQMTFDGPGLLREALPVDGLRPEQKLQSQAASFELPSSIEIGLAYDLPVGERYVARLNSAFANNNLAENTYHFGTEVGYVGEGFQVYGRGGYNFAEKNVNDSYIYGATLGGGVTYRAPGLDVTVDYAWRDVKFFKANNVVSVKLGF
jgi:hypothetical protein